MKEEINISVGGGFAGPLTIVFIVLKLTETSQVADWSWWWVLSPMWVSFGSVQPSVTYIFYVQRDGMCLNAPPLLCATVWRGRGLAHPCVSV